jgi:hypothetical protein
MASKWFTPEQIISKLREAEVLLAQGAKIDLKEAKEILAESEELQ